MEGCEYDQNRQQFEGFIFALHFISRPSKSKSTSRSRSRYDHRSVDSNEHWKLLLSYVLEGELDLTRTVAGRGIRRAVVGK